MFVLLITVLVIGALAVGLGGRVARRAGLADAAGQALALAVISVGLLLAPRRWNEILIAGDAAERALTLARDIGITGLVFLAGFRVNLDTFRTTVKTSMAGGAAGLLLSGVIAIVLSMSIGAGIYSAIVIAACFTSSSVWLPFQLSSGAGKKQLDLTAAAASTAVILAAALLLVVHLLGAFHEVAGRARSLSAYSIVAVYELVKVGVFFSLSWFVATMFLVRVAKADARVSDARRAIGYFLIAVMLFVLGRALVGEFGALAWSFIAGALFTRSEVGKRMASYRPAAAAMFLSLGFLPMFLQLHGRSVTGFPAMIGAIAGALVLKFTLNAIAAKLAGHKALDARIVAAVTLASGEIAVALLAFSLTRWVIDGPVYFAVLFFALLSMIAAPIAFRVAANKAADQAESLPDDPTEDRPRKSHVHRTAGHAAKSNAGFGAAIAVAALLSAPGIARAQTASQSSHDNPVSRAMRAIEESINPRAAAADKLLAASKLVNESRAARQQGKSDLAREAVTKAESIGASEFNRSVLIDELLRLVSDERAALDSPTQVEIENFGPERGFSSALPRSVRARLEEYRGSFARILEEERIPVGLLGVALVESGFNPMAHSPKGARGIWQFMPATAVRYGLAVQPGNDHRTHPEHSTRAAARYLRFLFNQFGDWKLVLAAYNAGEQRVQRIVDRTGIRDFDEMSRRGLLPLETRKYVPAVLAAWSRIGGIIDMPRLAAKTNGGTNASRSGGLRVDGLLLPDRTTPSSGRPKAWQAQ